MLETPDVVSYNLGRRRGHESLTHRPHGERVVAEQAKLKTPDAVSYYYLEGDGALPRRRYEEQAAPHCWEGQSP
jgi:hypothetical protein